MKKIFTLIFLFVFTVSCGYKIETKKTMFKKHYNLYVSYFKNKTNEPRLEDYLIKELKKEFILYPNVKIVFKDQANFFLNGEILDFQKTPISYSETNKTLEYRVSIKIKVFLYDKSGKIIKQNKFSWSQEYPSDYKNSKNFDVGVSENQKKGLIIKICRDLSSEIYHWLYSYNF